VRRELARAAGSDGQALAALGAACVDNGAAATGLHADLKAVGACAAHFGGLVGAFHGWLSGKPTIIAEIAGGGKLGAVKRSVATAHHAEIVFVDKALII